MTCQKHPRREAETRHYAFLLLDSFTQVSFSCAMEPLRLANLAAGLPRYSWQTMSLDGAPVRSSSGTTICVDGPLQELGSKDTLVIVGGFRAPPATSAKLLPALRKLHAHGVKMFGICGGVVSLAAAGLLDGLECAVDWQRLGSFQEQFPRVKATEKVFVLGKLPTAASGVSSTDLMLQIIGVQSGGDVASQVGEMLSYGAARLPNARQQVSVRALIGVRNEVISGAIQLMQDNIDNVLAVSDIGAQLGVSVRQIERLFARYLKESPGRYYTRLRLERARGLLRDTNLPVIEISVACGFSGASHFSKIYRKQFGNSPASFRAVQLGLPD